MLAASKPVIANKLPQLDSLVAPGPHFSGSGSLTPHENGSGAVPLLVCVTVSVSVAVPPGCTSDGETLEVNAYVFGVLLWANAGKTVVSRPSSIIAFATEGEARKPRCIIIWDMSLSNRFVLLWPGQLERFSLLLVQQLLEPAGPIGPGAPAGP
ncbi:hypothetical protein G7048_26540 (plasmid) [Diaphorobacter sp. HDW4B]|uniref:hypothetical protein n=1 Tax=Diaphorobacter sp. HDW4B TaxID=2714925 RepID=UPI00140C5AE9|nr:hypothetical protein [Diaphorobacter sp. HDW4B]QIL73752.1 hypothetical protein G7048_26540 [Diaphorobacter sp. HDW4B]